MSMIMYAEVRKDGEWHKVGNIFKSAFSNSFLSDRVCDDRNYFLYAVLGRVQSQLKNYSSIVAINDFKGMPDDASDAVRNHYCFQGDNISYLMLPELFGYDWNRSVSKIGCISEWQYKRLKKEGIWPVNVNRQVFDQSIEVVTPFEMDMILADDNFRKKEKYYVRFEYDAKSLKELCSFFCNISLPALRKLVPTGGSLNDVRVIYTFVGN